MKFDKLISTLTDDNELDSSTLRLLSLAFLFLSGIMSFFKYTHIGWLYNTSVTFKPGLISLIRLSTRIVMWFPPGCKNSERSYW